MSIIFPSILITSIILLLLKSPSDMLTTFNFATEKTIELCFSLIVVYSVWQGLSVLLEKSGISNKIAKLLKKPIQKLFHTNNEQTVYQISLNLTANAFGLSGMATPAGIESMKLLDDEKNEHGKTLLAVISSTSIQILPISVVQLLATYGEPAGKVIIVSLISTIFSTTVGVLLAKVFK